ncbi:thiolase family protein [Rhizomonospora bruguierae]|uniref:thiolase family protein n=1 Tax=Rhizomonospora bruguierae TaxID=1581705 RepID=UPI001BD011C7|nr:thiolase family protein [Micromonospora sp. NBRC 107566]
MSRVAIIGVGTTPFGAYYKDRDATRSDYDLAALAFAEALDDAGIAKDEIDGLLTARLSSYNRMADMLGLRRPSFVNGFEAAGRMSAVALQTAVAVIEAGLATTVALIYGNNGRSAGARYGGDAYASPTAPFDAAYGMTSPGAYVAMMYQRYQELYQVPEGALAPLAITNRANAALNPNAVMRTPITEEAYLAGRFVAEPLRLFDYCLINDGGVALIVTTEERARKLGRPVVTIEATAACGDLTNYYTSRDFFFEPAETVARRVYKRAGITTAQVDVAQIYDNFTPTILFSLEGFGFAERGRSWEWVRDGRIARGGELPINTSGGHTSESYMQGWALHVEAVRQLRGEAGERQVSGAEVAQYICVSPIVSSHIFRRRD